MKIDYAKMHNTINIILGADVDTDEKPMILGCYTTAIHAVYEEIGLDTQLFKAMVRSAEQMLDKASKGKLPSCYMPWKEIVESSPKNSNRW